MGLGLRCSAVMMFTAMVGTTLSAAPPSPFTIEQVMSSPFPSGLVASPTGNMVAWVFDARGVRNIWVAGPPDYRARALTAYDADDGQEIAQLAWTPDAQSIVYTRGGDFETRREAPNPLSLPQGVEQDIWVVALAGGASRKLAEGHSPAVSPKGDVVAFLSKDQVWLATLNGSAKPVQLIQARGKAGTLRWSPDGSQLAFVSSRDEHSLIAVYDFARKSLDFLDPGVDQDAEPAWSPDGKQIAFLRIPSTPEENLRGARRSGPPWSIRVASVANGEGREVWRAREGQGSVFHEVNAEQQLLWTADDRLIFPWEGDGWTHLYSVPAGGGEATLMTPGEFEVEDVSLSPEDRREVIFNSNQDDTDRRHLWREAANGDHPTRLTGGRGIEWSPVMLSGGDRVVLLRSDAHWPARPALVEANGAMRDLAPQAIPADFPAAKLVEPQPVLLSGADGLQLHGQIFLPAQAGGERHPAVVFFHGGSRRQMLLGWHYMQYYHNSYALNQYLASRGYIVLSVNYRSGIGYGMKFREALNYGPTGASEFNDVQGAGLYLRSRPDVDPARIALWGGSYGGYLTALGLARASDLFACGVDFHGVHDWNLEFPMTLPAENPQKLQDWARVAFLSSPLADVKTWRSPVLLIQGDDDRNVSFRNMIELVEALRKQGVDFQQIVFPDEIHDFLLHAHWLAAYHATSDYLDGHLQNVR